MWSLKVGMVFTCGLLVTHLFKTCIWACCWQTWIFSPQVSIHAGMLSLSCFAMICYMENSHSHCSCGHPFSAEHTVLSNCRGFLSTRHNEVRNITASLLSEVCHAISMEPHLLSLWGESMSHRSAITNNGACLDIAVHGFCKGDRFEKGFTDMKVFNPCARSNYHVSLTSVYR